MNEPRLLTEYRDRHNKLIAQSEAMPNGDDRAVLIQIIDRLRGELIRASNLVESGQDPERVYRRIEQLLNGL